MTLSDIDWAGLAEAEAEQQAQGSPMKNALLSRLEQRIIDYSYFEESFYHHEYTGLPLLEGTDVCGSLCVSCRFSP